MQQGECLSYLRSMLPSLKGVERKIGEFLIDNPENFINMTVKSISLAIQVSEGSIINFSRKLGFDGFTAMKISVAMSLQAQNHFVLGDISIGGADSVASVMTQVFESVCAILSETLRIISHSELHRAVEVIMKAKHIEFYGLGTSAPIVQDAYYRFMRIGVNATACVDPHIMCISASQMGIGNLAIAISHTGRSKQTVLALREAKEHGADTLCITSYADSPITQYADITLLTSPGDNKLLKEATVARIAHIALLDSLCTYIAMQNSTLTTKLQDKMLNILESQRHE